MASLRRRRRRFPARYPRRTRKKRQTAPNTRSDKEREAARLVNNGVPATEARRRVGLEPLPQYLTYRPRGRLARHLAAGRARTTRRRVRRMIPRTRSRWRR